MVFLWLHMEEPRLPEAGWMFQIKSMYVRVLYVTSIYEGLFICNCGMNL